MPLNIIKPGSFLVAETILYDSLYNLLLKLRCVAYVWYSFLEVQKSAEIHNFSGFLVAGLDAFLSRSSGQTGFFYHCSYFQGDSIKCTVFSELVLYFTRALLLFSFKVYNHSINYNSKLLSKVAELHEQIQENCGIYMHRNIYLLTVPFFYYTPKYSDELLQFSVPKKYFCRDK